MERTPPSPAESVWRTYFPDIELGHSLIPITNFTVEYEELGYSVEMTNGREVVGLGIELDPATELPPDAAPPIRRTKLKARELGQEPRTRGYLSLVDQSSGTIDALNQSLLPVTRALAVVMNEVVVDPRPTWCQAVSRSLLPHDLGLTRVVDVRATVSSKQNVLVTAERFCGHTKSAGFEANDVRVNVSGMGDLQPTPSLAGAVIQLDTALRQVYMPARYRPPAS